MGVLSLSREEFRFLALRRSCVYSSRRLTFSHVSETRWAPVIALRERRWNSLHGRGESPYGFRETAKQDEKGRKSRERAKSSLKESRTRVLALEGSRKSVWGRCLGHTHNSDDSTAKLCREAPPIFSKLPLALTLLRHVKNCILSGAGPLSSGFFHSPGEGQGEDGGRIWIHVSMRKH